MSFRSKLVLALLTVYLVWGSTFLAMKVVLNNLMPFFAVGIRFFIGGLILLAFTYLKEKQLPDRRSTINALAMGLLLTGIGNCGVSYAIHYIPTGIVALISATTPLWVFMLNLYCFNGGYPSNRAVVGLTLGLIGMAYLLNPFQNESGHIPLFPALTAIIGSISWSYGSLKSKEITLPTSALQSTALQMISGGFLAFIISFFMENGQMAALAASNANTLFAMLYLMFMGSFLGFTAYIWLFSNAEPQLASTYAYINPIIAIILGAIFLGEEISQRTILASGIILTGVLLMTLRRQRRVATN